MIKWGTEGGHAMTYVGYDDQVGYDTNADGKITNDVDLDGDGKITLTDWERGAFLFADSKGTRFADQGKAYVLYRVCAMKDGGAGRSVSWVKPKKEYCADADAEAEVQVHRPGRPAAQRGRRRGPQGRAAVKDVRAGRL